MRNTILCGFGLLIFGIPCKAQMFTGLNSLESTIDAEQLAMGESFAAYRSGLTSFKQNPATLTGLHHLQPYYSYRENEIFDNSNFYEFGIAIKSPIGVSNINYARFNLLEIAMTDMSGQNEGKIDIYDHNLSLNHGYKVNESLSLGLSIKWIDLMWQVTEGDVSAFNFSSTPAIIGDIGMTYQFNGLFNDSNIKDSLALGTSVQNFGSDLKYELTSSTQNHNKLSYQTPRFFKIGFAYGITAFSDKKLPVFEYVLTGQYGRWLNPDEYYKGNADLGGIGTKIRFWEALELNIGGYYQAYFSSYGNEDVLNIRYGVALNIPFRRWGWDVPITAKFSFTQLPINQGSLFFNDNNKRSSVFTGQISYNVNMF